MRQINTKVFMERLFDDARKRNIVISEEQANSLIPELEAMYEMHESFMPYMEPQNIITASFVAGILHALGGFKNTKGTIRITGKDGNFNVEYLDGIKKENTDKKGKEKYGEV